MYLLNVYIYLFLCKSIKFTQHMNVTVVGIQAMSSQGNFVIWYQQLMQKSQSIWIFKSLSYHLRNTVKYKVSSWPLKRPLWISSANLSSSTAVSKGKCPQKQYQSSDSLLHSQSVKPHHLLFSPVTADALAEAKMTSIFTSHYPRQKSAR